MARGRPSRELLHRRVEETLQRVRGDALGLPSPESATTVWSDLWERDAHHSTAIEGNTLVRSEVRRLLTTGAAVGAKPLADYMEVQGYADAARWVFAQAVAPDDWTDGGLITVNELRRIHHMAMSPVWSIAPPDGADDLEGPGSFRRHEIRQFSGGMTPPSWVEVPARIAEWVAESCSLVEPAEGGEPLADRLARSHNRFEQIHPFIDGNGRTGRLALNLMLIRLGYPPIVIEKRLRSAYLGGMRRSDAGDHGPLGELIARCLLDSLSRFVVANPSARRTLVPLAVLVDDRHSLAALRQAAQRGRLEAVQGPDGVWLSSRTAVDEYSRTKHRRRPAGDG